MQLRCQRERVAIPKIWVTHADSRKASSRDRYLLTAQIFLICFATSSLPEEAVPFV